MPGLTIHRRHRHTAHEWLRASMEGRARARPDQQAASLVRRWSRGRPPSMEGRARARPDPRSGEP